MNQRTSANSKIDEILNAAAQESMNADDEQDPAYLRRLARNALYGVGRGGMLPRVKIPKEGEEESRAEGLMSRGGMWSRQGLSSSLSGTYAEDRSGTASRGRGRHMESPNSPVNYLSGQQSFAGNSLSSLGQSFPFYGDGSFDNLQDDGSLTVGEKRKNLNAGKKNRYAHDGMYSVITFASDPNKVFYDCTPCEENPNFPPWYVGYQNSTSKPTDIPSVATRYGSRGAYNMKLHHVDRNSSSVLVGGSSSSSLNSGLGSSSVLPISDEYTPTLHAAVPRPGGPNFCSPSSWPSNSVYPTGFKGKKAASSPAYIRETTVNLPPATAPLPDKRLVRTASLDDDETRYIKTAVSVTRSAMRSMAEKSTDARDDERAAFEKRPTTKHMRKILSAGLLPSKSLKLSGKGMIIKLGSTASGGDDSPSVAGTNAGTEGGRTLYAARPGTSAASLDGGASVTSALTGSVWTVGGVPGGMGRGGGGKEFPRETLADKKWLYVGRFVRQLLSSTRNPVVFDPKPPFLTGCNNLDIVLMAIKDAARQNKHSTVIYRPQFIHILTTKVEGCFDTSANAIFASFDVNKTNQLYYAPVIGSMLLLAKSEQSTLECLSELWALYQFHKGTYSALDVALEIFKLPCEGKEDEDAMDAELRNVFRPCCYRLVSFLGEGKQSSLGGGAPEMAKGGQATQKLRPSTSTYNLCNGKMDRQAFEMVCRECESTVALFDRMRVAQQLAAGIHKPVLDDRTKKKKKAT